MADNSVSFLSSSDITDLPYTGASGIVAIFKGDSGYGKMLFLSEYGKANYMYSMNSSGAWRGGWVRLPIAEDITNAIAGVNTTIEGHVSKLFYADGERVNLRIASGGVLTSGKTKIIFSVPLSKSPANINRVTLWDGNVVVRQNGQYLMGSGGTAEPIYTLGNTCTLTLRVNCIEIEVNRSSGFSGTNNDTVHVLGALTVDFHA